MKTDLQLKKDVEDELEWEPSVNAAHIGVSVKEGVVTLTGHVPSYGEKYGAEGQQSVFMALKLSPMNWM